MGVGAVKLCRGAIGEREIGSSIAQAFTVDRFFDRLWSMECFGGTDGCGRYEFDGFQRKPRKHEDNRFFR